MCMDTTVPLSAHTAKNGSHSPLCRLGSPRTASRSPVAAPRLGAAARGALLVQGHLAHADVVGGPARRRDDTLHRVAVVLVHPPGDVGAPVARRPLVGAAGELGTPARPVLDTRSEVAV